MSKQMSYYEWLDSMGIEEDTDETYDAYLDEKRLMRTDADKNYCIFEKKICPYANKQGNVFQCKAPSDDDMPCNK